LHHIDKGEAMHSRIYIGDSREILPSLIDEFNGKVALLVTSPPYYIGRGYEDYLDSWIAYWEMLENVFDLTDKLIEPWGKIAVNFADKYANAREFKRPLEICYAAHYSRLMAKHDLWARIIWDKMRVSIDGARHINDDRTRFTGNMRVAPNWEYIFVWRKRGKGKQIVKNVDMTKDEWKEWVNGIWRFSSVSKNTRVANTKFAVFPEELPRRLIRMFTAPGDIIIDPFAGKGTSIKVARRLGRVGIGIEKNPEMLPALQYNLRKDMFIDNEVKFIL